MGPQIGQLLALTGGVSVSAEEFVGVIAHLVGGADATAPQDNEKGGGWLCCRDRGSPGALAESEQADRATQMGAQSVHGADGVFGLQLKGRVTSGPGQATVVAENRYTQWSQGVGEVVEEGLPSAAVSRAVQQHDAGVHFVFGEAENG